MLPAHHRRFSRQHFIFTPGPRLRRLARGVVNGSVEPPVDAAQGEACNGVEVASHSTMPAHPEVRRSNGVACLATTIVTQTGISLIELNESTCRWPMWDGITKPNEKRYCGEPAHEAHPYCRAHCQRSYWLFELSGEERRKKLRGYDHAAGSRLPIVRTTLEEVQP